MKLFSSLSLSLATALMLSVVGCSKKEPPPPAPPAATPAPASAPAAVSAPVTVKQVVLSKQIDAAKKAVSPAVEFAINDTIYAVVETSGSGKAALKALWTFHKGEKVAKVDELVQEVTLNGPAATEFHIGKPSGWPVGNYQVEIFVNEISTGVYKFSVK